MSMSLNTDEKSNHVCHSRIITVKISLEPNHGDRLMRLCLSWSLILCKFAQVFFGGFQLICRKNVSIFVGFASFTLCDWIRSDPSFLVQSGERLKRP